MVTGLPELAFSSQTAKLKRATGAEENMLRILKSLLVITAVAAIATGATSAYFSDTETSTGNTFTSGTLDLTVDNQNDPLVVHITRSGLIPYPHWSHSYGGQWVLKNNGNIPGKFSMEIKNIQNLENSCIEPETTAGDVTCGAGIDQGELGGQMFGKWLRNASPWGGWGSTFSLSNASEGSIVMGDTLNPGDTVPVYLDLEWDTAANNNLAQGDSLSFDIVFHLDQV
jgi:predicted ribosomally synthesized peptide with SipW-like signal peptide